MRIRFHTNSFRSFGLFLRSSRLSISICEIVAISLNIFVTIRWLWVMLMLIGLLVSIQNVLFICSSLSPSFSLSACLPVWACYVWHALIGGGMRTKTHCTAFCWNESKRKRKCGSEPDREKKQKEEEEKTRNKWLTGAYFEQLNNMCVAAQIKINKSRRQQHRTALQQQHQRFRAKCLDFRCSLIDCEQMKTMWICAVCAWSFFLLSFNDIMIVHVVSAAHTVVYKQRQPTAISNCKL